MNEEELNEDFLNEELMNSIVNDDNSIIDDSSSNSDSQPHSNSKNNVNYLNNRGNLNNNILNRSNDNNRIKDILNKNNQNNIFSRRNNRNNENNPQEGEKVLKESLKEKKEQITDKALQKGASAAMQSGGIPKPVADKLSEQVSIKKIKKKFKIYAIITAVSFLIIFMLIIIPVVSIFGQDGSSSYISSGMASKYLYKGSNAKESSLINFLIEEGYCDNEDTCRNSDAYKFYAKLKDRLSNYDLTKGEADAVIISLIRYNREDEEIFKKIDEIDYLANIFGSNGKFYLDNIYYYKNEIIGTDGYLEKYRSDLFIGMDDSAKAEYKESIFESIIAEAKIINESYKENGGYERKNSSVCSGVTVTGENVGTYDLEDYVAKVVTKENNWSFDNTNLENMKAYAIIVRTYTLQVTNNCTKPINSSDSTQLMALDASPLAISATKEVANKVLVDDDENLITITRDLLCSNGKDSNDNYILCQAKNITIPKVWVEANININDITNDSNGARYSIAGSRYLSTQNKSYEEILKTFYSSADIKTLIEMSEGLEYTENGFLKRVSRAFRDNNYFYGDSATNEGECAWYAVHRTNEILGNIGSDYRVTSGGNGNMFCYSQYGWQYDRFPHIYDVNQVKPGMVVSWDYDTYGHVAVIEDVEYDSNGDVAFVYISESSNSRGIAYNRRINFGTFSGYNANNDLLWNPNYEYNANYFPALREVRQFICEGSLDGSTGNGCQVFTKISVQELRNRWNGYTFICAIDLLG